MTEPKPSVEVSCVLRHPFTAVVAGPTGCDKTAWVRRLIDNAREMIEPVPSRIWYYYSEYQTIFNNYPFVQFHIFMKVCRNSVMKFSVRENRHY